MKIQGFGTFLVLIFAAPLLIAAQTNIPANPIPPAVLVPLPENPDSAMTLARQVNGLDESGTKSWHIRAKYEIYDSNGRAFDQGVYEEVWAGPKKYRRSYTGSKFTQTDYASADGLYRSGDQEWPMGYVAKVRRLLVQPFDYLGADKQASLMRVTRKLNKLSFVCLAKKPQTINRLEPVPSDIENYPQDCFDPDKPILRLALKKTWGEGVIWNNLALFQGRFVARDIKFSQEGKVRLIIHLDLIQEAANQGDETFVAPVEAKGPITGKIQANLAMTQVFYAAPPVYPDIAKARHVQGVVRMQITVSEDGLVTDVKVIEGHVLLRDAAVEAARKWRFEPVLVMGDPVEIELPLEIYFNIAH
jgi:TonB family protein